MAVAGLHCQRDPIRHHSMSPKKPYGLASSLEISTSPGFLLVDYQLGCLWQAPEQSEQIHHYLRIAYHKTLRRGLAQEMANLLCHVDLLEPGAAIGAATRGPGGTAQNVGTGFDCCA